MRCTTGLRSGAKFLAIVVCTVLVFARINSASAHEMVHSLPPMSFGGEPEAAWLEQGRRMRLTKEFAFADSTGYIWRVPAGTIVDGASIPQPLWSWTGGPFEGRYRNASILHDYFDHKESHPWRRTHALFFSAAMAAGEELTRALQMLRSIVLFGTKWVEPDIKKLDAQLHTMYLDHDAKLRSKYELGFDSLFDYAIVCLIEFPGEASLSKNLPSALRVFDCGQMKFKALDKAICDDLSEYPLRSECKREQGGPYVWPWQASSSGLRPAQKFTVLQDLLWYGK